MGSAPGNYRVGSYVDLRTVKEKDVPVEIIGPDKERLLSLSESAKATTFQFPSQGFFDIRRANGREEMAAVNPDRRESDFAIVPRRPSNLWKNTGIASKQALARELCRRITAIRQAEIWWWVLAMLAVLAIAETVLGNRQMTTAQTGD